MEEEKLSEESTEKSNKRFLQPATLKRNKEFAFAYRKGQGKATRNLVCICAKSRVPGIRVGYVVSKKVGNSVQRNLIRRRMKEAFRLIYPELTGNYSVVFVARTGIVYADFKSIQKDMLYLLKKQKLFMSE